MQSSSGFNIKSGFIDYICFRTTDAGFQPHNCSATEKREVVPRVRVRSCGENILEEFLLLVTDSPILSSSMQRSNIPLPDIDLGLCDMQYISDIIVARICIFALSSLMFHHSSGSVQRSS